jgi:hypothetical protein
VALLFQRTQNPRKSGRKEADWKKIQLRRKEKRKKRRKKGDQIELKEAKPGEKISLPFSFPPPPLQYTQSQKSKASTASNEIVGCKELPLELGQVRG